MNDIDRDDHPHTHTHSRSCAGTDLVSAAEKVPKEERYTDWWDRNGDCQVRV